VSPFSTRDVRVKESNFYGIGAKVGHGAIGVVVLTGGIAGQWCWIIIARG